jgi:hypothetical protein
MPPSDNDAGAVEICIRFAQSSNNPVTAPFGGAEIHEKNLVFVVMNYFAQGRAATHQIRRSKLALEDGELEVISETAHEFEDFAQAFIVGNVITNEEGTSHRSSTKKIAVSRA